MIFNEINARTRPFLSKKDLENKWIWNGCKHVINVSQKEQDKVVIENIENRGATYVWIPIGENRELDVEQICKAMKELLSYNGEDTIVHCDYGNNRSRLVCEFAHYAMTGVWINDELSVGLNGCHNKTDDNIKRGFLPDLKIVEDIINKNRDSIGFMEELVIPAHLKDIEYRFNVKVLLAVESGSRAWGFESKNSDWDVRFIYVHKPEWYFRVEEQRDVIEHIYEDDVDLAGWELRKALSLLRRSNPSLLEWFHSPKVYYIDEEFGKRIAEVEKDFFNPVKSMYHYYRIYNKHNERYLQQEGYHMKRFLYYLRGVLACQWIERNRTIPPVRFKELYEAMVTDADIKAKIEALVEIKREGKECDMISVDNELVEYAQRLADYYNESVGSFCPEQNKVSVEALDYILYDMVKKNA